MTGYEYDKRCEELGITGDFTKRGTAANDFISFCFRNPQWTIEEKFNIWEEHQKNGTLECL